VASNLRQEDWKIVQDPRRSEPEDEERRKEGPGEHEGRRVLVVASWRAVLLAVARAERGHSAAKNKRGQRHFLSHAPLEREEGKLSIWISSSSVEESEGKKATSDPRTLRKDVLAEVLKEETLVSEVAENLGRTDTWKVKG